MRADLESRCALLVHPVARRWMMLGLGVSACAVSACSGALGEEPPPEEHAPEAESAPEPQQSTTDSNSDSTGPSATDLEQEPSADVNQTSPDDQTSSEPTQGPSAQTGTPNTMPGSSGNPNVAPTEFECLQDGFAASPAWRRLSHVQYQNTLRDLLDSSLGDTQEALLVLSGVAPQLAVLPEDERPRPQEDLRGTYRRLDQGVAQEHVDNWYELAVALGQQLTTPERIEAVVGECASQGDAQADQCLTEFILNFGARALRRPLTDDEVERFRDYYGDTGSITPEAFADVIGGILNAPQFLYQIEHGAQQSSDQVYTLDAFELASRLSYHFTDSLPDDGLWAAALDGSLLDEDVYQAQVERLSVSDGAKVAARDFFREWLKLENLPALNLANSTPRFQAFAADSLPTEELNTNMIGEVVDLLEHFSFEQDSGFQELLTTQLIFPKTDDLARIYGVSVADAPVQAPDDERPGLFTRAAFLATGSANTRPIIKGVFLRENILCDHIPPPPAGAMDGLPELSDDLTTRQKVEALTEGEGTACAACHAVLINPLGYASENYDALGRYRVQEALFDSDGMSLGNAPVDTHSVPRVTVDDDSETQGASELMSLIAESGKAEACLARQYFRYSFGRFEDVQNDGCALEQLRSALVDSGSLREMLKSVALTSAFRQRTILR